MATLHLFVLSAILGLLLPTSHGTQANNYLLTGQTLDTDQQLSYDKYSFVMQGDCNLVLYNGGWQSDTANRGQGCKLTLNNYGQLNIKSESGSTVFTTDAQSKDGKYAAVLHPVGKVVVYGPAIWSTRPLSVRNINHLGVPEGNTPRVENLLFSGQVLYGDARLTTRNYDFVMQGDCNLVLYGGGWQSNTHGNGRYCFLRLDHTGMLSIRDDSYNAIWSSNTKSSQSQYVLILQEDGKAVIYGPAIWSTKSNDEMVTKVEKIAMVTADEVV